MKYLGAVAELSASRILTQLFEASTSRISAQALDETYEAVRALMRCMLIARAEGKVDAVKQESVRINAILWLARRFFGKNYSASTRARAKRVLRELHGYGGSFAADADFAIDYLSNKGLFWMIKNPENLDPIARLTAVIEPLQKQAA